MSSEAGTFVPFWPGAPVARRTPLIDMPPIYPI